MTRQSFLLLAVVAIGLFCSCGNNKKQSSSILPTGMQEVIDFRDSASAAPITETQLIDGFYFGMSNRQFDFANQKHEQTGFITKKYILGGIPFKGGALGSFSNGGEMYELEITVDERFDNGESVTKQDFDSIADALKVLYGKQFIYMYAEKPATSYPTHLWRKNNLLIRLEANLERERKEILISYTNMPVLSAIQQKIAEKDKERRDKREKAIMAAGAVEVTNSSYDASVSQVKDYLRKNLKDPKSYESIEWSKVKEEPDGYSVYHKYRAKNSFGGYVIEAQIFYLDYGGNVIRVQNVE